jgi:hypothetical protein
MRWIANVLRRDANSYRLNLPYRTEMGAPMPGNGRTPEQLADDGFVGIYRVDGNGGDVAA